MSAAVRNQKELEGLSNEALVGLFSTLEAPTIDEMNGEYAATLLSQPSLVAALQGTFAVRNPFYPGVWLAKCFRPVDAVSGRGYNSFSHLGRTVQRYPMRTVIARSRFDGKPAYQLVYRAYRSFCGDIHMVDEVRRLAPGLYLGIGTWGFNDAQRRVPCPSRSKGRRRRTEATSVKSGRAITSRTSYLPVRGSDERWWNEATMKRPSSRGSTSTPRRTSRCSVAS